MDTARRIFDDLYNEGCSDLQLNYYNKTPNVYVKKIFWLIPFLNQIKAN